MPRFVALIALVLACAPVRAADFDPAPVDGVVDRALAAFHAPLSR